MRHVARPPLPLKGFSTKGKPTSAANRRAAVSLVIKQSRAVLMPASASVRFRSDLSSARLTARHAQAAPEAERFARARHRFEQRLLRRQELMKRPVLFVERARGGDELGNVVHVIDAGEAVEDFRRVGARRLFRDAEQADAFELPDGARRAQALARRVAGDVDDAPRLPCRLSAHALASPLAASRFARSCASRSRRSWSTY